MSSDNLVKELFRNLENVFHDRLRVIEEILSSTRPSSHSNSSSSTVDTSQGLFAELEEKMKNLNLSTHDSLQDVSSNYEQLVKRVSGVERSIEKLHSVLETIQTRMEATAYSDAERITQIETDVRESNTRMSSLQKQMEDETPVEAAEVEAEIDEAEEAALEETEETAEEEEVAEEEEEAAEEEEESPFELLFTFENRDYYEHKETHDVFIPDESGTLDPDDVRGIWNPKTEKMWDLKKKKWWDYKTNKYTEPKKN